MNAELEALKAALLESGMTADSPARLDAEAEQTARNERADYGT